jgi:pimeloyl-ACP methyl ester carboxylesterase
MANLKVIAAQRARAREALWEWTERPLTLRRRVYFVPGFTDEGGLSCWGDDVLDGLCFATEVPEVCENAGLATFVNFEADGAPPHYEDFIRFGARLARLVEQDRAAAGPAGGDAEVDLVCHSMGGLDALAAIALLDDHPGLGARPLAGVRNVITFDTPFLGFAAARNPLYGKLKRMQRPDEPWLMSQLLAMDTGSLRIAEVAQARERFLARVQAFWPRGADNTGGLIEVPHESASFGGAPAAHPPETGRGSRVAGRGPGQLAPAIRGRYRGYRAWEDTSHSGAKGLTRDPRAIVEVLEILTRD